MNGRKILLINYYWPPCGGPAVQRWLDITCFLAEANIQTFVVTIDESVATYPFVDETLKRRIDPSTKVYTTDTSELFSVYKRFLGKVPSTGLVDQPKPSFLQKVARFVRGNLFLPDPRIGWNKHAYKMAAKLINENGIDTVFTAGPPHSSHLIGLKLKRKFPHIKWFADFHDYWTEVSYLSLFYRTSIASFFDKKIELKVLKGADAVMTHCNSSRKLLSLRLKEQMPSKIFVHTMGFNEDLFQNRPSVIQDKFVISYVGMLAANYEPETFFKAVRQAIDKLPDIPVVLRFVGKFTEEIKLLIHELNLDEYVELPGYLPHQESVEYLYKSSVLFLLGPKYDNEQIHVPGKLYEYLAAFKPIINIGPLNGETASIISKNNAGQTFERGDVLGMSNYIVSLMNKWDNEKTLDLEYNPDIREKYGRKNEAFALGERIITLGWRDNG